ncbi:hypothetical protein F4777DRAFT_107208 [Nemania sp. FL0916]|nr:hypothetical protein F4777DRAFT_107208 [Nemania sp. FL0916]
MASHRAIPGPYADERRHSGNRYESYRPDGARPPRRDYRRDNEPPPRPFPIDTNVRIPEGPRSMSTMSPASALDKPPDDLHFRRMSTALEKTITTTSVAPDPSVSAVPQAKNAELQEAFANAYRWAEKWNERLLVKMRKKKAAQEFDQRRVKKAKTTNKAAQYPPYDGLCEKFENVDRDLDEDFKVVEDDYRRELEQLVARFTTAAKPDASGPQSPAVSALEKRVEQVSQLLTKQSEQIQSLLKDNKDSRKSVIAMETSQESLKANYDALKSDYDKLVSKQQDMDNENKGLKNQLETLRSDNEKAEKKSNERITNVESKFDDLQEFDGIKDKLEGLDSVTLDDICTAWMQEEDSLESLYKLFKGYRKQYKDDSSIDDIIRRFNEPLPPPADPPKPSTETETPPPAQKLEEIVKDSIMTSITERDEIIGEFLDGLVVRVNELEQRSLKIPGLEAHIQDLEQWKATRPSSVDPSRDPTLVERVARLEEQNLRQQIDQISHILGDLSQKFEAFKSRVDQSPDRELLDALHNAVKDLQRKLPAMDLAVSTLDSQFQNLSTKQMAEDIVRLTNPVIEQRLGKLEGRTGQLESKTNSSDRVINEHASQLNSISTLLRTRSPGEKRTASPNHLDEPSKKRRLEANGRRLSPLQQEQRNR